MFLIYPRLQKMVTKYATTRAENGEPLTYYEARVIRQVMWYVDIAIRNATWSNLHLQLDELKRTLAETNRSRLSEVSLLREELLEKEIEFVLTRGALRDAKEELRRAKPELTAAHLEITRLNQLLHRPPGQGPTPPADSAGIGKTKNRVMGFFYKKK